MNVPFRNYFECDYNLFARKNILFILALFNNTIMFFTLAEISSNFIGFLENKFINVGIGSILYLILYFVIFMFFGSLLPTVNKYGIYVIIADLLCAFIYQNSSVWFTKEHFTQHKTIDNKDLLKDQEYIEEEPEYIEEEPEYIEEDPEETGSLENEELSEQEDIVDMSDMSKIQNIVNDINQLEDDNMTNDSVTPINENLISE